MTKLEINKKPFAVTSHYAGVYSCASQWEDEITTEDYGFTVEVTNYSGGDIEVEDVNWDTLVPRDEDAALDYISEHFFEITG